MSLFTFIKSQIVKNENEYAMGKSDLKSFVVSGKYPQGVIVWLTEHKVFKVDKVERIKNGYEVYYKELDIENDFFKFSKCRTRMTEDIDDYRHYSTGRIDQAQFYEDEKRYEKLSGDDSCLLNMKLRALGYESYSHFMDEFKGSHNEAQEELMCMLEELADNRWKSQL